jgi:hypothetical protein
MALAGDCEDMVTIDRREWRWVCTVGAVLLVVITAPYILAERLAAPDRYFMGMLVNPLDGTSYLVRMVDGYEGSWLFHLTYTPEHHQGVFLYTFYLALGHLSHLLDVPPILVFHTVRLLGSMLMFVTLYLFIADWTADVRQRRLTWGLCALGCGFGWIALMFQYLTPDLLAIPEAFPLQAAYANPHFPLAIAAGIWVAHTLFEVTILDRERWPGLGAREVGLALCSLFLVSTTPFILAPLGIGFGAVCVWRWWREKRFPLRAASWGSIVAIAGLPPAIYNAWAISTANPAFHAWSAQNLTPSPPPWDYLIAFGPLLILAGVGLAAQRRPLEERDILLIGWLVGGIILLYGPLGLQRRFSMGLIVPLAIFAGQGLVEVVGARLGERWQMRLTALTFGLFLPTTLLAILLPVMAVSSTSAGYYSIDRDEAEALNWLASDARPDSLVLASPSFSLYVPLYGQRVVYAHPYETLHAEAREQTVLDYYGGLDCEAVMADEVDYVVMGEREKALANSEGCPAAGEIAFRSADGEITIYDLRAE